MKKPNLFSDVTSELLGTFSPYLQGIQFNFRAGTFELQVLDTVEAPRRLRVLTFERVRNLQINPHDPDDIDPECLDSVIGIERSGDDYCVHTADYAVTLYCTSLQIHEKDLG